MQHFKEANDSLLFYNPNKIGLVFIIQAIDFYLDQLHTFWLLSRRSISNISRLDSQVTLLIWLSLMERQGFLRPNFWR
ncbi:Bcr/CflA family drug resistance efflux transporter, partial [Vibrio sp. 10N.222.51.A6]